MSIRLLGTLGNGDLVVGARGGFGGDDGPSDGRYRRPLSIRLYGEGRGPEVELTRVPGDEMHRSSYWTGGRDAFMIVPHPFGIRTSTAVGAERVCVTAWQRFEIRCRSSDGRLRTVIRDSVERRPVTEEAIERLRRATVEDIEREDFRRRVREAYREVREVPERMPALDRLLMDSEGHLWARVYRLRR